MSTGAITETAYLVPLAGPPLEPLGLTARAGGLTIGRHEQCDLHLPADAENVSRFHARFDHDGSQWHIADLGSAWGTFVNGVKLLPQREMILSEGDLIRITPWTLSLSSHPRRRGVKASDDMGQTMVRTIATDRSLPLADATLALLLECASAIYSAPDEKSLGELIIDAAVRGTGLTNAALLHPVDAQGRFAIVASRFTTEAQEGGVSFSHSLIAAASRGEAAEIGAGSGPGGNVSQSMVQLRITSAICVPLMLGTMVAAYLYLDSRGTLVSSLRPGASAFCVALGRIASLALANLKRMEMEKRELAMRAELSAAAAAQKWIMPKRQGKFGVFSTIGDSKAGQYVGGDFFDLIPLRGNRLAVAVGDVSGKGVSASVLMTATEGYLHAALLGSEDPGQAVTEVNQFVNPRRPANKFVTMWVGIFDADSGMLTYVDAGHSYALLKRKDGTFEQLDKGGGLPIGVDESVVYNSEPIKLEPGDEVMIVSDGIIEQFGMIPGEGGPIREQFQIEGVQQAMARAGEDEVADLFAAVVNHAGTDQLSDDATAVLVKWG